MIQPLRDRHRLVSSALALAMPAIFLVGIAKRPPDPVPDPSSMRGRGDTPRAVSPSYIRVELVDGGRRVRVIGEPQGSDPLLYCSQQQTNVALPSDATFVGEFSTERTYSVPEQCGALATWYVFSGATRTVFDSAKLGGKP